MSKYNSKKVIVTPDGTLFKIEELTRYKIEIEGIQFDSEMEGAYYQELLMFQKDGAVTTIQCQPKYILQDKPKITYIADFLVTFANGEQIVVDVKGVETSTFSVKKRMFAARYPELKLQIITKYRGAWMPTKEVRKEKAARKRAKNKFEKKIIMMRSERSGRI